MVGRQLELTPEQIKAGVHEAAMTLLAQDGSDDISRGVQEIATEVNINAIYIPSVKFILDATLNIVGQPDVDSELSPEVYYRNSSAIRIAQHIAGMGVKTGFFEAAFKQNPGSSFVPAKATDIAAFTELDYIASLGASPISDASIVTGGALNFLRMIGIDDTNEARQIVHRSTGLLAITGVHKGWAQEAFEDLGMPYVSPDCLEFIDEDETSRVTFAQDIKEHLANFQIADGGCPAGRLRISGGTTLLEEYWKRLVDFLIPDDATADLPILT